MVSYSNYPITMYQSKHGSHLPYSYTSPHMYPNYPPSHHPNNQYLGGSVGAGGGNGIGSAGGMDAGIDGNSAPSPYFNPHHHMFHQSSPDWAAHDNFALQSAMGSSSAALHFSQSINNGLNSNNSSGADNLSNEIQNIPPSPPITVNSGCSEMSSPGITNGGGIGNGNSSPHMNNGNSALSRPKSPYEWMKKQSYQIQPHPGSLKLCSSPALGDFESTLEPNGKTRTKDKYRVVYSDYQRLELEKEYHMSRYITIRRKSDLAVSLGLSERQVKIWFQNRRAKERKQSKKRDDPAGNVSILSNGVSNGGSGLMGGGLSLQHHNMSGGGMNLVNGLNGLEIKTKMEPGLGHHTHPSHMHNLHHHHHHSHPIHQLSSMGMGLHNSIAGLHLHHSSAAPPPLPSPATSSVASSIHQQHTHLSS